MRGIIYESKEIKPAVHGELKPRSDHYHVTATDARNYIILGDPAVRL